MRNQLRIVLAASLALSGVALAADQAAKPANSSGAKAEQVAQKEMALQLPAGFQAKSLDATSKIDKALSDVAQDAVSTGHFDKLVGNLVDQDRDRLRQLKNPDTKTLDGIIGEIQKQWRAKYGKDFDASKVSFANDLTIVTGQVSDPQLAVGQFPVDARTGGPAAPEPQQAAASQRKEDSKLFGGEVKLDKGRDVALVRFPAMHGSALTISMIHEFPEEWRIDIPHDRTGYEVLNDLQTQLTDVSKMSA